MLLLFFFFFFDISKRHFSYWFSLSHQPLVGHFELSDKQDYKAKYLFELLPLLSD